MLHNSCMTHKCLRGRRRCDEITGSFVEADEHDGHTAFCVRRRRQPVPMVPPVGLEPTLNRCGVTDFGSFRGVPLAPSISGTRGFGGSCSFHEFPWGSAEKDG